MDSVYRIEVLPPPPPQNVNSEGHNRKLEHSQIQAPAGPACCHESGCFQALSLEILLGPPSLWSKASDCHDFYNRMERRLSSSAESLQSSQATAA